MRALFGPDQSEDEVNDDEDDHDMDSHQSENSQRSSQAFSPRRGYPASNRSLSPLPRVSKRNRDASEDTSLASRSVNLEGNINKIYINEKNDTKTHSHIYQATKSDQKKKCCNKSNWNRNCQCPEKQEIGFTITG